MLLFEGLVEVVLDDSILAGAVFVVFEERRGQHDDGDLGEIVTELIGCRFQKLEAIHARHVDVEKNGVDAWTSGVAQEGQSILGHEALVKVLNKARSLDDPAVNHLVVFVVVNEHEMNNHGILPPMAW